MTALALAAKAGYDDIVLELLSKQAYLNIVDKVCFLAVLVDLCVIYMAYLFDLK